MAILDRLMMMQGRKAAGALGSGIASHGIPGLPGFVKSMLFGSAVGGAAGLIRGDNYNATAALKNFAGGAIAGAGIGFGARTLMSGRAVGGIGHILGNMVPKVGKNIYNIGGPVLNAGLKTGSFLSKHPGAAFMGAAAIGTAAYMGGAFNGNRLDNMQGEFIEPQNSVTGRGFQNSAIGLVQGLHSRRHR